MNLLEQLHQLAPLAALATPGPWFIHGEAEGDDESGLAGYNNMVVPQPGAAHDDEGNYNDIAQTGESGDDAAFIAAARNLLTPENLTLLTGALAAAPPQNPLIAFLLSSDTGMSSKAIAARYAGVAPQAGYFSFPYDSGDFGRCHRLLELVPGLDIAIMRGASATWDRLVAAWPALTTAYEALQATNDYKHFRALMEAVLIPA